MWAPGLLYIKEIPAPVILCSCVLTHNLQILNSIYLYCAWLDGNNATLLVVNTTYQKSVGAQNTCALSHPNLSSL